MKLHLRSQRLFSNRTVFRPMSDGYLGQLIVVCCLLKVPFSHALFEGAGETQGYISLVYDTTEYKYPYQMAGFGPKLGYSDKNVTAAQAHLFIMNPNIDSIEATLCNVSSLQRRWRRNLQFVQSSNGTLLFNDTIALLLPQGPCTTDVQVLNAMRLNQMYSTPNSRNLSFVFIFGTVKAKYPLTQTSSSYKERRSINIYTFFLDAMDGMYIWNKIQKARYPLDYYKTANYNLVLNASVFNPNTSSSSYFPLGLNQPPVDFFHRRRFFTEHFKWVRFLIVLTLAVIVLVASVLFVRRLIRRRRIWHRHLEENPPMNFDIHQRILTQDSFTHITREYVLDYLPEIIYGSFTSFSLPSELKQRSHSSSSSSASTVVLNQGIDKTPLISSNLDKHVSPSQLYKDSEENIIPEEAPKDHSFTSESVTSIDSSNKNNPTAPSSNPNNSINITDDPQINRILTSESIGSVHSSNPNTTEVKQDTEIVLVKGGDLGQNRIGPSQQLPMSIQSVAMSCTACSICIDEFVVGEKVRILPRCGHIFHSECIVPWLTEREDTCPLCKMPLFDPSIGSK